MDVDFDIKELRIGNTVQHNGAPATVTLGMMQKVYDANKKNMIDPGLVYLSINDMLLKMLGFEKKDINHPDGSISKGVYVKHSLVIIKLTALGDKGFIAGKIIPSNPTELSYITECYFIHQVQNLYHCITGKNLEMEI